VPEGVSVWETKWFTIDAGYFEAVDYYIWLLFVKGLTISVLSLWYISSTYWWRFFLFTPVISEFNKVYGIIYTAKYNTGYDINFFFCSLVFSVPYVVLLYFVAKRFNYYKPNKTINNELNTEINEQILKLSKFNSKDYKSVKKEWQNLLKGKENMPKKEYLLKIMQLRNRLVFD